MNRRTLTLLICLSLLPQTAFAHLVSTRFGEFYSGILHPLSTLSHLLPWIAIALLCGMQRPQGYARWALVVFPVAIFFGALMGSQAVLPHWIYLLNLTSFLVGLMVALALKLNASMFFALLLIFGFSHGFANGEPDLRGSDFVLYVSGVAMAAYLLITLLSAAARFTLTQASWGSIALRAGGSWIMAIGVLHIGFYLMIPAGLE